MSDIDAEIHEQQISWLLDEIRKATRSGISLPDAIAAIMRNPFATPDAELVEEARVRYLQAQGKIARYEPVDSLTDKETETGKWYDGTDSDSYVYWPHVREVLRPKLGDALEEVNAAADKVLSSLRPPGEEEFDVRGLVLGFVQSGKTTNFISLISKAADVGYRLIIVLAGMTDNLRRQTQERLEEQLVNDSTPGWVKLTTMESDFNASQFRANNQNANTLLSSPDNRLIAVVKKNGHILKGLNNFLNQAGVAVDELPILVIDDESDQASINVSKQAKAEVSKINAQIRTLLRNQKTAYVAYTATPFANILIDPNDTNDLYPRDFIHVLPRPKGYFGTETLFGRPPLAGEEDGEVDGLPMIRTIPTSEIEATRPPGSRKAFDQWSPYIPDSLDEALRWFILATAARRARGQESAHSSMLIHTAVRVQAHNDLHELIKEHIRILRTNWSRGTSKESFHELWEEETQLVHPSRFDYEPLAFEEIEEFIPQVFDAVEVIMDNGDSQKRLAYEETKAKTVIAIGGNTLARGLTLEGLVCSYFVRTATAYDTLLQMGRWFGFRNGYADLPRIWMTEELEGWFQDLALVEADLRQDLARYASGAETPLTYQARIRVHPSMEVTARAKQQSSRPASVSYSGRKVQTILFRHKDRVWLDNNIAAAKQLVSAIQADGVKELHKTNGTTVFKNVAPSTIIEFLESYTIYEESVLGRKGAELLKKYVRQEHETGSIRAWDVSFYGKGHFDPAKTIDLGLSKELGLVNRSQMVINSNDQVANIKTLVGSLDRLNSVDLDSSEIKPLVDSFETQESSSESKLLEVYEEHVGQDVAHLAIYAIDPESTTTQRGDYVHASGAQKGKKITPKNRRKNLDAVSVPIGIGIFFPTSSNPDPEAEYVSTQEYVEVETMQQVEAAEEEALSTQITSEDA
ncbi:Z1 domain-containing protein [uncultured Corynebacterium sp.]|mgnify:CR=1 FL=1|uniref:Z1 domain-containing protein n=1 Tax=uncultured Corynebacterium sp. TaxID=159447 RepID=UPI0025D206FD|nr:Z1 domain-containing protein [uncultured Corynebacterium sp.]